MDLLDSSVIPEHARGVKAEAKEFADEYIAPNAEECFREGEYPWEILEAGQQAGLVAQDIGEEYGGRGFDLEQELAIGEEFFRADAGIGLTLRLASVNCVILERHGNEQQKEEYLPPVANCEELSGIAISEPEPGASDMAGLTTTAEKDGDEWVLNGEKYWVGNGVEADWLTVYAKTGDRDNRHSNYSLFIVPTENPGYEAEHIPEKMAMRASKQGHIIFDDCRIPEENIIGEEGDGFHLLTDFFNHGRVIVAAGAVGLAAAAIEEAWDFVHDREAFNQSVSDFQSVQHMLADMRMEFEAARSLTWDAAKAVKNDENPGLWSAMAKTKASEVANFCAERGMQLHGGRSVLADRRISRVYRDVRVPVIYEGANEIQRNIIYSQQK
ncbi:acyl-CoA dehydrogenase family protein [Natrialbaceae archaeon A-gly3]